MLNLVKSGSGIPLVFIHAFPLSKEMWEGHTKTLSKNFQFIRIDLPGFGSSPLTSEKTTMEMMADQVLETLDSNDIKDKAIFAGLSMGGYVLFQIWKKASSRVRALAFISTRSKADTDQARAKRFQTIDVVQEKGPAFLADKMISGLFGKTSIDANVSGIEDVKNWIKATSSQGIIAALRGMAERDDSTPMLSQIDVPTWVASGNEDQLVPTDEMKAMAEAIPKARFDLFEGGGHLLNLEKPGEFEDGFLKFLKRAVL